MTASRSNTSSSTGQPEAGEALLSVSEGSLLPLVDPVVDEGVVHVVADRFDRPQVQRAVDEDAALPGMAAGSTAVEQNPGAALAHRPTISVPMLTAMSLAASLSISIRVTTTRRPVLMIDAEASNHSPMPGRR